MRMSRCVTEVKEQMDKQRRRRGRIVAPGVSPGVEVKINATEPAKRAADRFEFLHKQGHKLSFAPVGAPFLF